MFSCAYENYVLLVLLLLQFKFLLNSVIIGEVSWEWRNPKVSRMCYLTAYKHAIVNGNDNKKYSKHVCFPSLNSSKFSLEYSLFFSLLLFYSLLLILCLITTICGDSIVADSGVITYIPSMVEVVSIYFLLTTKVCLLCFYICFSCLLWMIVDESCSNH